MSRSDDVRVELLGLASFGPHGVTAAERDVGCRIVLDIAFTVPGCAAVDSDELADTVDYGAVAALASTLVRESSCRTLERLAGLIADGIAERFGAAELEVRAAKPEPPIPETIGEVAVTLVRRGGG